MSVLPPLVPNSKLILARIPLPTADWNSIQRFALTFYGYDELGDRCAELANARLAGALPESEQTLTVLRSCLFFEQRRWRHFGDAPEGEALEDIRRLLALIRHKVELYPRF